MKKKIEYLSDQVEKLNEALREEKFKVSAATAELRRLEMKNRLAGPPYFNYKLIEGFY